MTECKTIVQSYEGYDLTILDEPVHLAAKASGGFRSGVIALTDTRLVYLRRKKDETFIDRQYARSAISDVTYKRFMGTWNLEFNDEGWVPISYAQVDDDLEPFVEPLQQSASENEAGPEEEQHEAEANEMRAVVGEKVYVAATVQSGIRRGVIALTETRLVFVRKKQGRKFIDCEFSREAIASATLSINIGGHKLTIEHDGTRTTFVGDRRQLEPFVEPLKQSTSVNMNNELMSEFIEFAEHDITIVGEPVLSAALVSGGWRSGVIVLTENRLVYLRKKNNETFIDRESNRSAITNVEFEFELGGKIQTLAFDEDHKRIQYQQFPGHDDLEPFLEPLRQSASENEARQTEEEREAEAIEMKAIVSEDVLLTAKASSGSGSGVIVLTENRLVYLRSKKGETYIDRDTDRSTVSAVGFRSESNTPTLAFSDNGKRVVYKQFETDDDLEPFVEPLKQSAARNITHLVQGYDLRVINKPALLTARVTRGFSKGLLVLSEDHIVLLRSKSQETYIDFKSEVSRLTDIEYDKLTQILSLTFDDGSRQLIIKSRQNDSIEAFIEPLLNGSKTDVELVTTYNDIDVSILDEPVTFAVEAMRENSWLEGIVVLTKTRFAFLQKKFNRTTKEREYNREDISDVQWLSDEHKLTFVCGFHQDSYVSHERNFKKIVEELSQDVNLQREREGVMLVAQGSNGTVKLFEDRLVISKVVFDYKSLLPEDIGVGDFVNPAKVFSLTGVRKAVNNLNRDVEPEVRQNEIALKDITRVDWKEPSATEGHIQFGYVGAQTPSNMVSRSNNAVVFKSEHLAVFEQLKAMVEKKRAQFHHPPSVVTTVSSPMDELKKLAELKELGIVTENEFEQKKKQLLGL